MQKWDVFISYAHEDAPVAHELASALHGYGIRVWIDKTELQVGDSLRQTIESGIANATFGIVVLSEAFFAKRWPQTELNGLFALEVDGRKVILPVWHHITEADVRRYSPFLADRVALSSSHGIDRIVEQLARVISPTPHAWSPFEIRWPNDTVVIVLPIKTGQHVYVIGKHPVTNREYRRFIEDTRHMPPQGEEFRPTKTGKGTWEGPFEPWTRIEFSADDQPVVCVSFEDAEKYCEWLDIQTPEDASVDLPPSWLWERAAMASLDDVVTYRGWQRTQGAIHRSASRPAGYRDADRRTNKWGVADMFGNVWEWTRDRPRPSFRGFIIAIAIVDPHEMVHGAALRGGSFLDALDSAPPRLTAWDLADQSATRHADLGFRVSGRVPIKSLPSEVARQLLAVHDVEDADEW